MTGLNDSQIESIMLHLSAQPRLNMAVRVEADEGDSDVQQGDIAHCRVSMADGWWWWAALWSVIWWFSA
jgi:hypothetical protein